MSEAASPQAEQEAGLARRLGLVGSTLSGVGIILGAGIYVIIGEAAESAGSGVWLSFVIAGVIAAATALSYAELASMYPEAGASSTYAGEAFGRRLGFLTGWLRISVGVIGSAAVAIGFGGYISDLGGVSGQVSALAVVALSGIVVVIGVRETVAIAVTMTLLEAAGLVFVIVVGLPDFGARSLLDLPEGLTGVLGGAALVFFAFEGFEQIATLSEETRDPTRTIPRAIVLAIGISGALYLLVAAVAVSVVDWRVLAASDSPLAEVVTAASSERAGDALSTIALFATGNTVLMLLATSARMTYGMASRRLLPPVLARVHPRRRTPWVASIVVTAAAALLTLPGDIGLVAQITNFAVFAAFGIVNASVIRLRRTRPDTPRPFRSPGTVAGAPIAALAGGAGAAGLSLTMDLEAVAGGALILLSGLVLSIVAMRQPEAAPGAGA